MALDAYAAKEEELGEETMRQAEKQIMLWAVDNRWVRHLTDLDRLREGIGLQAFAQVDPLVAYKREAFNMYGELMNDIRGDIVKAVLPGAGAAARAGRWPTPIARNIRTHRGTDGGNGKPQTVRKTGPQLGRNDPCWCGSGKKYKTCHMKSDRAKAGGDAVPAGNSDAPPSEITKERALRRFANLRKAFVPSEEKRACQSCYSARTCRSPAASAMRWTGPPPSAATRCRSSPRTIASGKARRSTRRMWRAGRGDARHRASAPASATPAT